LAAAVGNSRKSAAEIDSLASEIAATATGSAVAAADAEILEFARTAAQAELDLERTRGMKTLTMNSLLAVASLPVAASTAHADELRESLPELRLLHRYEQRAAARRDRAVLHIIARIFLCPLAKM
jgi:hypothetical protein